MGQTFVFIDSQNMSKEELQKAKDLFTESTNNPNGKIIMDVMDLPIPETMEQAISKKIIG